MQALSQKEKRRKLRELARDGGHASVVEMLKACVTDSVSPAICTAPDCRSLVPLALHEHIEDLALGIDGTP